MIHPLRRAAATTAVATAVVAAVAVPAHAASGPMGFDPIDGTPYTQATSAWTVPLVVPEGYTQSLLMDETGLDIYAGDDLTDMNTVNETGPHAGRYLYRTHEVDQNGALSVVDLQTGQAKVLAQDPSWNRLDGLRWTPWGTLLFAEETSGGHLYEAFLDPADPARVSAVVERPEVGVLRHEGIEALGDGSVFVIDELNGGSVYRFVPTRRGDLSDGQLYALRLTDLSPAAQTWDAATVDSKVGAFTWVPLDMTQAVVDADAAANAAGATEFGRPEDVEVIGRTLYVANTTEDRVIAIDLDALTVSTFVQAGRNVPVENAAEGVSGFNSPDNLAQGPDGRLWVVEDNYLSDIWVADHDLDSDGASDVVSHFAGLKDTGAEISGIYFGKDPRTLMLNIQHPDKGLADGTWAVTAR